MGRTSDVPGLVYHAAKAMLAEGQRPTVSAIRERIGKGSNTTILKALKEWEQTDGLDLKIKAATKGDSKLDLGEILSLLSPLLEINRKTQHELSEVKSEFIHFRSIHSDRLSSALTRLEDAYKILMVASDASRNEASRWKEKLDRQEADFFNRENIFKHQIANLEARLGERTLNRQTTSLTFLPLEEKATPAIFPSPIPKDAPAEAETTPKSSRNSPPFMDDDFGESLYE